MDSKTHFQKYFSRTVSPVYIIIGPSVHHFQKFQVLYLTHRRLRCASPTLTASHGRLGQEASSSRLRTAQRDIVLAPSISTAPESRSSTRHNRSIEQHAGPSPYILDGLRDERMQWRLGKAGSPTIRLFGLPAAPHLQPRRTSALNERTPRTIGTQNYCTLMAYSASSSFLNSTKPNPWWTPVTLSLGICTFATGPA